MLNESEIKDIINQELEKILTHQSQLQNGCAACHVMFSLKSRLDMPEQDCADLVSEVLTGDRVLNEKFIYTVEQIHMIERKLGGSFTLRERESKDAYLEVYFSNVLEEIRSDLNHFSYKVLLRKLLLAYLSLYIAQTIGVDYHAATEELYYILRKDEKKNLQIEEFISKIETKIRSNIT